jgi:hypothetical protein
VAKPPPNFGATYGEVALALRGGTSTGAEGGGTASAVGRALVSGVEVSTWQRPEETGTKTDSRASEPSVQTRNERDMGRIESQNEDNVVYMTIWECEREDHGIHR